MNWTLSLLINNSAGVMFYSARQYDQAIEALQKTLEIAPNLPYAHVGIGYSYLGKSMYEEALAEIKIERQLHGDWSSVPEAALGFVYARMGKRDEAQQVLDGLLERSKKVYIPSSLISGLYGELGEYDQGFDWLEKAYRERDQFLCWLKVEPLYDSVRSDPRYTAMLKKMGLDK